VALRTGRCIVRIDTQMQGFCKAGLDPDSAMDDQPERNAGGRQSAMKYLESCFTSRFVLSSLRSLVHRFPLLVNGSTSVLKGSVFVYRHSLPHLLSVAPFSTCRCLLSSSSPHMRHLIYKNKLAPERVSSGPCL